MNKSEIDNFLKKTRIATLVTLNPDGSPNALPLWYEWDSKILRMFSSYETGKIRRLTQDNRACVSVHDPVGVTEAWVTIEGKVELKNAGGRELALKLVPIYYSDKKKISETLDVWSKKSDWILLELTPTRILSWQS
tara:strand:+ start:1566 stop:1973 length:408 start_codon:yes stop_codon:yes gene_type:complete